MTFDPPLPLRWPKPCFGPWFLRSGSSVIALVRWSISHSLNISETVHWFFLIFCMKSERARFLKKIFGGHKWGKTTILGAFLMFLSISLHPVIKIFWNFTYITSSTLSNSYRKPHVQENSGSGCIVGTRPLFFRVFRPIMSFVMQ